MSGARAAKPVITMKVSDTDVNVMSWSRQTTHLLASGADDGEWAVWDLRQWKPSARMARPATHGYCQLQLPQGADHEHRVAPDRRQHHCRRCCRQYGYSWDLAVELDDEESKDTAGVKDVPPQLYSSITKTS